MDAEPSRRKRPSVSFSRHMSLMARAVFPVSFLECTNTSTWRETGGSKAGIGRRKAERKVGRASERDERRAQGKSSSICWKQEVGAHGMVGALHTWQSSHAAKMVDSSPLQSQSYLVLPSMLHDFLIHNLIHDLEALDGLLLGDAHVRLLEGHRSEAARRAGVKRQAEHHNRATVDVEDRELLTNFKVKQYVAVLNICNRYDGQQPKRA